MERIHKDASDAIADAAQTLMRRQQSRHLLLTQPSILASRTRASLLETPAHPSSADAARNTLHGTNSRHSLDQTRLSETLGSSTSTFKAALPAQGRVQRWAKTRCLVSSDCVRATATGSPARAMSLRCRAQPFWSPTPDTRGLRKDYLRCVCVRRARVCVCVCVC